MDWTAATELSFVLLLFVVSIIPLFMSFFIASLTGNLSSEALSLRPFTVVEFPFIVRICYSHANPRVSIRLALKTIWNIKGN